MKSTLWRIAISAVACLSFGWLSTLFNVSAQLVVGGAAANQFDNSDAAFVQFTFLQRLMNGGYLPFGFLFIALALVWWKPLAKITKEFTATLLLAGMVGAISMSPTDALAYYDKMDRAEWVEVGGNQSAFLLPMVGANKDKQKQFGSVQYLNENKIPAKRVQIPHVKADNTALLSDFYVPSAKLFIVDRTPFNREWCDGKECGTSAKNQGFHFESAEGINIDTGLTISAFVTEDDAAKFFYWFGSTSSKPATTPEEVFASVAYGKSLAEVMDSVVRGKAQTALAKEFGKRKFRIAVAEKAIIIEAVEKAVRDEFADKGITIAYVGYSGSLNFAAHIQTAIDQVFIAETKFASKDALLMVTEIDRKNAEIGVTVATGETMQRWNGQINLPSFMVLPDGFFNSITGWFSSAKK